MLAMLRRVRKAVGGIGETEWALIAIEAVGVIASILIAFSLDDWANERREQARSTACWCACKAKRARPSGLLLNSRSVDSYDLYAKALPASVDLSKGACPANLDMIDDLSSLQDYDRPSLVTFDELKNRVGLSSIPDDLRVEITTTSYQLDYMDRAMAIEDKDAPALLPLDDPRRHAAIDPDPSQALKPTSTTFVDDLALIAKPRVDRAALCGDPAFREGFVGLTARLHYTTMLRNDTLTIMIRLCEKLSSYTGEPCFDPRLRKRIGASRLAELDHMVRAYDAARP